MRIKTFFAAILLSSSVVAQEAAPSYSVAASPWPEAARGRAVPRPEWVLVIPAYRHPDGSLSIWDRSTEWTKAWRVPQIVGTMRIVTLIGDSEDQRTITARAFDDMEIAPIETVLRKYGAPAVALAVSSETTSAVAMYVPGYPATWEAVEVESDEASTHVAMVSTIAGMTSGQGTPVASRVHDEMEAPVPAGADLSILAFRPSGDGYSNDLQLTVYDPDYVLAVLQSLPGVTLLEYFGSGEVEAIVRYAGTPQEFEALSVSQGLVVQ